MPQPNLARVGAAPPKPHSDVARPSAQSRASTATTAPPRVQRSAAEAAEKRSAQRKALLMVVLCAPLVATNIVGIPYYIAAVAERVRHPMHAWLRPSGYVGQSAGIIAFLIFVFLWLYPLRKKWKALKFTGSVGKWLDVHVASALLLPLLLAIHAAWRSEGLIGLGMVSMFVVILSGVIGRYLYTRIPRAKSGVEFTREEVAAERRSLIERLAAATGLSADDIDRTLDVSPPDDRQENPLKVLGKLLSNDLMRWRLTRQLRERWRTLAPSNRPLSKKALREAVDLASQEISLTQQARMLTATQRVFRYWHVAHRPFAITALVAVAVHVVVVIAVGATWFR